MDSRKSGSSSITRTVAGIERLLPVGRRPAAVARVRPGCNYRTGTSGMEGAAKAIENERPEPKEEAYRREPHVSSPEEASPGRRNTCCTWGANTTEEADRAYRLSIDTGPAALVS